MAEVRPCWMKCTVYQKRPIICNRAGCDAEVAFINWRVAVVQLSQDGELSLGFLDFVPSPLDSARPNSDISSPDIAFTIFFLVALRSARMY